MRAGEKRVEERKHFLEKVLAVLYFLGGLMKVLGKFIGGLIIRLMAWYKRQWVKFTHNKYEEFVYKRGLAMAAFTLVFVILIPTLGLLIFQTGYYLATYKKDSIYLIQSEEIYPDDNIWGVRGCYTQVCDSNSSIYFRIKPSLFHQLWSLSHHGTVFLPDIIGSSVPTGLTKCEIVSYGLRLRILMTFNVYPSILEINCQTPLNLDRPSPADPQ
jgi:hypothetical protein